MPEANKTVTPLRLLKVEDLKTTHSEYDSNVEEWDLLMAVFEGIKEIKRHGLIERHEREPMKAYQRRLKELYSFDYSKSIIEIFQLFLFKKEPKRTLAGLHEEPLWKLFYNNANLYGEDYDSTMMDISMYAAVLGQMGILVDKPGYVFKTKQEQVKAKVYPYIARYFPKAILDWAWGKDQYGKPMLVYIKLLDDNGQYRIWTPMQWEVWEMPEQVENKANVDEDLLDAVFIEGGVNPIGMIPFIWFYNIKSRKKGIGRSDIHGVARIDLSIIRNLTQTDQIINFAAFPMMRKPMRDASPVTVNSPQGEDEVGVEVVLEFDPEHPDSKPDWLPAEVAEPVGATLDLIQKKISEIYRAANIGGMAATEPTASPQSGVAKRIDFQLLNSKLVSKAMNLEDAENRIVELWLRWENMWEQYNEKIKIAREKTYDIEDLSTLLDDALTAKTVVLSKKFNELLQKQVARSVLPTVTEDQIAQIDSEIEQGVGAEAEPKENPIDDENLTDEDKKIINEGMNNRREGGEE